MVENKDLVLDRKRIIGLYSGLERIYGPQGWWPLRSRRIHSCTEIGFSFGFNSGGYHPGTVHVPSDGDIFEIAAGAVLTQNTNWTNAATAVDEMICAGVMSAEAVAGLPHETLAGLIRSSGYYNQKALKLKAVADFMTARSGIPARNELLDIRGVGPETADSILLYAYGIPEFVIDAYSRRIFARFTGQENVTTAGYNELKQAVEGIFPEDLESRREYHALLVLHAKKYCRKVPLCTDCPVRKGCRKRKCLH